VSAAANVLVGAGPIGGLLAGAPVKIFFLGCVVVAGVFGAATVNLKILWVQALPAAIALALVPIS
jgi:putative membrane protein